MLGRCCPQLDSCDSLRAGNRRSFPSRFERVDEGIGLDREESRFALTLLRVVVEPGALRCVRRNASLSSLALVGAVWMVRWSCSKRRDQRRRFPVVQRESQIDVLSALTRLPLPPSFR
jgi:hypothetical protein